MSGRLRVEPCASGRRRWSALHLLNRLRSFLRSLVYNGLLKIHLLKSITNLNSKLNSGLFNNLLLEIHWVLFRLNFSSHNPVPETDLQDQERGNRRLRDSRQCRPARYRCSRLRWRHAEVVTLMFFSIFTST